jgi:hypothetical protein
MAQQKLYTEEQVKRIAKLYIQELYILEAAINTETPIELPSDEDINERSYFDKDNDKLIVNAAEIVRFRYGAKWIKEQILNQNK